MEPRSENRGNPPALKDRPRPGKSDTGESGHDPRTAMIFVLYCRLSSTASRKPITEISTEIAKRQKGKAKSRWPEGQWGFCYPVEIEHYRRAKLRKRYECFSWGAYATSLAMIRNIHTRRCSILFFHFCSSLCFYLASSASWRFIFLLWFLAKNLSPTFQRGEMCGQCNSTPSSCKRF